MVTLNEKVWEAKIMKFKKIQRIQCREEDEMWLVQQLQQLWQIEKLKNWTEKPVDEFRLIQNSTKKLWRHTPSRPHCSAPLISLVDNNVVTAHRASKVQGTLHRFTSVQVDIHRLLWRSS